MTVYERGGDVLGIIPDVLAPREVAGESIGETIIVESMHERKALMAREADAFVAMPGGYGTLDELFEAITWGQIGIQRKPIGLYNVNGYFDHLLALGGSPRSRKASSDRNTASSFIVSDDASTLLEKLALHEPPPGVVKLPGNGTKYG